VQVAHVDRANVASYDYSAVLYLNTQGESFRGGDFQFIDEESTQTVQPRHGRCVLFSSGFEHLHRVTPVSAGHRFALAAWFTLTEGGAEGSVLPTHYEVIDAVPPPTELEAEAAGVNVDELREEIERKFG